MRPIRPLLPLLPFLLLACSLETTEEPVETRTLRLEPFQVPCWQAIFPSSCLVALSEVDTFPNWDLYHGIEGFDFEWGRRQEIEIAVYRVDKPPQDGSSLRYVLQRILKTEAAAAWAFPHALRGERIETFYGDTLRIEGYPASIRVPDPTLRARIAARADSGVVPLVLSGVGAALTARLDSLASP